MLPDKIAAAVYWGIQPLRGKSDIRKRLQILEETQWLHPNKLEELSFRKLEALVKHAYDTVPYYHELMNHHGFVPSKFDHFDDLNKLPILTRDQLEKNFDSLKSSKLKDYHAYESCSSGSTGQPARFMQDANYDMWCRAHQLRTYRWCGDWSIGQRFALVWGSPVYWDKQTVVRRAEALFTNRVELNCNNVGVPNLERILEKLVEFKPVLISGYSTALYLLADLAAKKMIKIESLKALQPNAEPTYDYMEQLMSNQFGVPVLNKYGSTETNIISHQSIANGEVMCIQSENVHIEFIKPDGGKCTAGENGQIVATTLNNYSMPLIRYQTSDIAAPLRGSCPTGRGFPLMSKVQGRMYDLIHSANGGKIHPQVFSNLFSNFVSVLWFQVVQNNLETLDIHLLMRTSPSEELEHAIMKMINLKTGGDFQVRFKYLDRMPETKTGKHKICTNNLPRE